MIVRTYGRRSRSFSDGGGGGGGDYHFMSSSQDAFEFDGDGDGDEVVILQGASQPLPPSQESSSMWDLDEDLLPQPERKRQRRRGRGGEAGYAATATATLMEAEEYGEMMESVDEVNFALDGLRVGAPRRVRRASLLALLGICASAERRRILRAQGLAQQIIDAILALNIDDTPCTIAATTLIFVLASDVQDDHLLDSESCICFLLKLLNPPVDAVEGKVPSIGSKLLGISKVQMLNGSNKDADSISEDIISKVEEILLSCKEIKSANRDDKITTRPELCSKWIALLTMEKACLSAVSLEETTDMVRRVGGNFKERLRELGGLDSIFDVMVACHSTLERLVKDTSDSALDLKEGTSLQSVALLLKCLKVMENATFLSKENQIHLLNLNRKLSPKGATLSFVGAIMRAIELLSALALLQSSTSSNNGDSKSSEFPNRNCSEVRVAASLNDHGRSKDSKKKLLLNQKRQNCSSSKSEISYIDLTITSGGDVCPSQNTFDFSQSISSNGASSSGSLGERHVNGSGLRLNIRKDRGKANPIRSSSGWISIKAHSSGGNSRELAKRRRVSENGNNDLSSGGSDPFAFDEVDLEPSKWEQLGVKMEEPHHHQTNAKIRGHSDCSGDIMAIENDASSQPEENHQSGETSSHSNVEDSSLLEDCLLTAVKVLMNLTNDNPVGCEQIASCGGLNTMASLITKHFPSFDFSLRKDNQIVESVSSGRGIGQDLSSFRGSKTNQVRSKQVRDHDLDFLVAILGLLVNLVEKDSLNRVRLASTRVSIGPVHNTESKEIKRDVIPLLCSIFLANQGAGEAAGAISLDDEESLLQGAREAEMMIVEAYSALLLAFLSTESMKVREAVSSCLPNNSLKVLVPVLERFVAFHLSLNMISPETHSTVTKVIESCKGA